MSSLKQGVVVRVIGLTRNVKSFGILVPQAYIDARKQGVQGLIIGKNQCADKVCFVLSVEDDNKITGVYGAEELETVEEDALSTKVALLIRLKKADRNDPI